MKPSLLAAMLVSFVLAPCHGAEPSFEKLTELVQANYPDFTIYQSNGAGDFGSLVIESPEGVPVVWNYFAIRNTPHVALYRKRLEEAAGTERSFPDIGEGAAWTGDQPNLIVVVNDALAFEISHMNAGDMEDLEQAMLDPERGGEWMLSAADMARLLLGGEPIAAE